MRVFDCILIGDESLTQHCAETLVGQGHRLHVVVTDAPTLIAWAQARDIRCEPHGPDLAQRLAGVKIDWLFSIANLVLLPPDVIRLAEQGAVNFHDGPLPRRAGLNAPVWALMEGDDAHCITWHLIEEGIDTGDILVEQSIDISPQDTALSLNTKCYEAGMTSFAALLDTLALGLPSRRVQAADGRGYHARSDRPEANGLLRFDRDPAAMLRMIRALDHGTYWNPLCTAKVQLGDAFVNIGTATISDQRGAPGTVLAVDDSSVTVACADRALRLAGLKTMAGGAVDPSLLVAVGDVLDQVPASDRDKLTDLMRKIARHDAHWRDRLNQAMPLRTPFAGSEGGALRTIAVDILPRQGCAAVACLARHLAKEDAVFLAAATPDVRDQAETGLITPWVPITPDQLGTGWPDIPSGFARDLTLREARLSALETPALGISQNAGPIPGVGLTFDVSQSGVTAHVDPTRIDGAFADLLIARARWVADQLSNGVSPDAVDALPEAERLSVLTGFNATTISIDGPATMYAAFEAQVEKTPDAIALVFQDIELSFAALNAQANQIAHRLRAMGVCADMMVGLHCARGPNLVAGALGILKAGGAYLPLDPDYPPERLAHYLSDSGAKIVVSEADIAPTLPETSADLLCLGSDPHLAAAETHNPEPLSCSANLAYVIYTSGSTGVPKGVMVAHCNVMNFYAGMDAVVPEREGAVWLAVTSLSFDISVLELFYTMARGIKVVLTGGGAAGATHSAASPRRKAGDSMAFSLYYWGNDDGVGRDKYRLLLEGAKFADDNGFCAVWTPERHFHAFGGPYPNPSVTGAAIAGVTRNIAIRAGSCVAPLHHPARIAEEWAVIDNLTNGKAGLAFASGWQPDDFVLRPENTPPDNKAALFQTLDEVRRLWRGEAVPFPRKDGQLHDVRTQPRPVSQDLPVWITTAGNPDTWREAGAQGAHVLTHLLGQSISEVAEKITLYRAALKEAGHNPDDFTVTLLLHTYLAATRDAARARARDPMKAYLRSAAGLIKQYAWAFPAFKKPQNAQTPFDLNLEDLSAEELDGILDFAFERYFNESGLFGTVQDALARVADLQAIGVSEIACLIDYGIETEDVLGGLVPLAEVVQHTTRAQTHDATDFSIPALLTRHAVTHVQCTPSMARLFMMDDQVRASLGGITHLFLGGEAVPGNLVADLNAATEAVITTMYGPTETTIWSSCGRANAQDAWGTIGTPIANTQLYILDETRAPVGIGAQGELWIGGAGVTRGYWQRPELSDERFQPNPFGPGRLYRTGDLALRRPDGRIDFLGRTDTQIKLRGYRIELGEIETVLQTLPGITQAVVLARQDTPEDARLVAYLTATTEIKTKAIRQHLSARLPAYMVPSHFVMLDAFPMTPNQKIDRNALRAPMQPDAPKRAVVPAHPARQPDEDLLAGISAIWTELLGVAPLHPDDNFFDLGGHSLLAVQTHRAMRERLKVPQLSITDIFQYPTLSALAAQVARLGGAAVSPRQGATSQGATSPQSDRAQIRREAMARRREMRARRPG